jgi:hypothetical protein
MRVVYALVILGCWATLDTAQAVPCPQVRAGVAQYGYTRALAWARAQGYSEANIQKAKACLVRSRDG